MSISNESVTWESETLVTVIVNDSPPEEAPDAVSRIVRSTFLDSPADSEMLSSEIEMSK